MEADEEMDRGARKGMYGVRRGGVLLINWGGGD